MASTLEPGRRTQGFELARTGDFRGAIEILAEHLSINGGDVEAHQKLADVYWKLGRLDVALEHLTIAAFNTPYGGSPLQSIREMLAGPPRLRLYPILTALRTGTWWNMHFFHLYHRYISGDRSGATHIKRSQFYDYSTSMQGIFCIGHSVCPGFGRQEFAISQAWSELDFSIPGYNYAHSAIETLYEFFNVETYANPGIVFLYRHPLDHFVSMWEQGLKDTDPTAAVRQARGGGTMAEFTPYSFAFHHGAECYSKLVASFFAMAERFPGRVMLQQYEDIVGDPDAYFRRVFSFFSIPVDEDAFRFALSGSSKDNLLAMEKRTGSSLAGREGSRHINDGASGKWRHHFSDVQIAQLDTIFAKVGLSVMDLRPKGASGAFASPDRAKSA